VLSSPFIRVSHLSHRYGSTEVLHDISFEVAKTEIFGFIGPNGAGKTTTIRIMATLLQPSSGRVEIDGIDVALEPERIRPIIGYMADQAGIYPKLTVGEYLTFFAASYRLDPTYAVEEALDLTGFRSARAELCGTLSKGMRQRLQLTKTLLHDPAVLVLDEPASDLDPRARIEMRDLFLRLRDAKKTIFLSSHILTELSDVCTAVGIIENGSMVASGPIGHVAQDLQPKEHANAASLAETLASVRRFKIRTLAPADAAAPAFDGLVGVSIVRASADQCVVAVAGGDDVLAALVKRLVDAGLGVVGVEPERDELETMFLELTKKDSP
jgi:ABC-2 type transport system ATP-binding protein